jgi:hypothetical protein
MMANRKKSSTGRDGVYLTKEGLYRYEGGSPRGTVLEGAWFDLAQAFGTNAALAEFVGISTTHLYRVAQGQPVSRTAAKAISMAAISKGLPVPPMTIVQPGDKKKKAAKKAKEKKA